MPQPTWQPLSMLPQIARLIDDMAFGAAEQLRNLAQAAAHPHLLDDATLDRTEHVYGEQQDFLPVYTQQLARWREGRLMTAQEREIARLGQVLAALCPQLDEILAQVHVLRAGTIDAIQRLSDEELGLQALLGAGSLGQAEDMLRAASGTGASGRVPRGKPRTDGWRARPVPGASAGVVEGQGARRSSTTGRRSRYRQRPRSRASSVGRVRSTR